MQKLRLRSRRPEWAFALLCAVLSLSSACEWAPDAELLELHALEPDPAVQEGWLLLGQGFPAGRDGRVHLSGKVHQPGAPSAPVTAWVPCHARGDRLAHFRLEDVPELRGLGPGHFQGRLKVGFAAHAGRGEVTGTLRDVRLRIGALSSDARRTELRINRQAKEWHARLGLTELVRAGQRKGVWVGPLEEDSLAARAGLLPGDVIRSLEGAPVEGPADLVPPAGVRAAQVVVERGDVGEPVQLRLPTTGEVIEEARPGWALALALFWLGAVALALAPMRPAPKRPLRVRPGAWVHLVGGALCAGSIAGVYFTRQGLELTVLWFAPALLALAYSAIVFARGRGTGAMFAAHVTRLAAASLAVGAALLLHGEMHAQPRMLGDAAWPWRWALLGVPPAWFCAATAGVALGGAWPSERVLQVLHSWLTWCAGFVFVTSLASGGQLPADMALRFDWSAPAVLAGALALWTVKVSSMAAWLGARSRATAQPAGLLWLGLTCPVLALCWLWLAPAAQWQLTLGVLASGLLAVYGLRKLWAALRRPSLVQDPTLIPFL